MNAAQGTRLIKFSLTHTNTTETVCCIPWHQVTTKPLRYDNACVQLEETCMIHLLYYCKITLPRCTKPCKTCWMIACMYIGDRKVWASRKKLFTISRVHLCTVVYSKTLFHHTSQLSIPTSRLIAKLIFAATFFIAVFVPMLLSNQDFGWGTYYLVSFGELSREESACLECRNRWWLVIMYSFVVWMESQGELWPHTAHWIKWRL